MADLWERIAVNDVAVLKQKDREYGSSWKKRGGVGAFMMLARKWDRLENHVTRYRWDIFAAARNDTREEGVLDDIQDLRRYLLLVEAELTDERPDAAVDLVTDERPDAAGPGPGYVNQ